MQNCRPVIQISSRYRLLEETVHFVSDSVIGLEMSDTIKTHVNNKQYVNS